MDPAIVLALVIVFAPALLVLAMLSVLGSLVVALADGVTFGGLHRPS